MPRPLIFIYISLDIFQFGRINFLDHIIETMDNGEKLSWVFVDLSEEFGCVNFDVLHSVHRQE